MLSIGQGYGRAGAGGGGVRVWMGVQRVWGVGGSEQSGSCSGGHPTSRRGL
jgi:hypothetical protein